MSAINIAPENITLTAVRAWSAEEALDIIQNEGNDFYDIIFMDHMMPEMDGVETTRRIRSIVGKDTPIIMLSAKGETFDKVLGLELGADDYIVKPFDPKELVARIKAVLRRYEPKQEESPSKDFWQKTSI